MKLGFIVLCCVGVNFAFADTYKAGSCANTDVSKLLSVVDKAEQVDVLVVPSDMTASEDYDEKVKILSKAAKQAGLYLVAHLKEKTRCQNKLEVIRSNLVFDREGAIVAVYRKPENNLANCTTTSGLVTFATDFGVTFGVMMEEDLVLNDDLKGLKNFVVAGAYPSGIPYFKAVQFAATWSFTHNVNLLSSHGIYAGTAGMKTGLGDLRVVDLKKNCDETITTPPVTDAVIIKSTPSEDLSQYIIRPLDIIASANGYKEIVCHNNFCCEFDLKTRTKGPGEVSYGLAAFNGVRHLGRGQHVGVQNCAVFACAGLYKRSCSFGSINNSTNIAFEKLTISANFTKENTAYPVIISNQHLSAEKFKYNINLVKNIQTVKMTVTDGDSLLTFGIFGRVFDRDHVSYSADESSEDFLDYIFNEDVQEFFDYLWIRVRILLFVVSIYVLEMM